MIALLAAAAAVAVGFGVAAAVDAGGGHAARHAVPQDQPGPVLLVPGYGGSTDSLSVLADKLRLLGKDVTIVALPGDGTGDLRAQARVLAREAKAAMQRTNASSVDVVGYSAGGVVARIWLRSDGGASIARRVVTLGSPQHGTELAGLGALFPSACPTACQQLQPDSSLLASLNRGDETPAGPDVVSIWSTGDEVVVPPDSASLQGALNMTVQSVCPAAQVSHGDLPSSPIVDAMVAAELTASPIVPLNTGDCARLSA